MIVLLFIILFVATLNTVVGIGRVKRKFKLSLILVLGIFNIVLTLPLFLSFLEHIAAEYNLNYLATVFSSIGRVLLVSDGDIFNGGVLIIVLFISIALLILQTLLVREGLREERS